MTLCRATAMTLLVLVLAPRTAESQTPSGIAHHNRLLLTRARVTDKTDGTVLVLTTLGATETVSREVVRLGGRIEATFPDVGYFRARLPLAQVPRLLARPDVIEARVDAGPAYYALDVGADVPAVSDAFERLRPKFDPPSAAVPPMPSEALAAGSAYVPMGDMGIPAFRRAHPTFDGRGVTIAVVEAAQIAFDHPGLQLARRLSGDTVVKLRGVIDPATYEAPEPVDTTDFGLHYPDLQHISRLSVVQASAGTGRFAFQGRTYWAPNRGRYTVGVYIAGGYPDEAGRWKGDSVPYAVLWDTRTRTVWVDTDRDRDFRTETPLHDINDERSVGYLRRDSTAAHVRDSIPFVVAFDSAGAGLRIYEGRQGFAMHSTMVASMAAGHGLIGGQGDGAAPGAQLILVAIGPTLGSLVEAFIRAARDPRVDLITCSVYDGAYPNAGESILPLVQQRLIQRYHKPIFAAADNAGPALGEPADQANSSAVISVGAYISGATYRAHYGWDLAAVDWLAPYSSRGPAANGAMKPDIVAPAHSIAAAPCEDRERWMEPVAYILPPCSMLSGGTSAASPAAAGAAAVLISAAKQEHLSYDAAHLAWALRLGARPLPRYAVHEQGHGLIDVSRTWELLHATPDLPEIVTAAPVRGAWSRYLRTPGVGVGLYEREGWAAGQRGTRIVTLTRTSGPRGGMPYRLRWRGNDGTFTAPPALTLPLGRPVAVPVRVAPRASGVHSAGLELVDPRTGYAVHEVLATIVAAEQFTAANRYRLQATIPVSWPEGVSRFVNVPPGSTMLRLDLGVMQGRYRLSLHDPTLPAWWPSVDPVDVFSYLSAGHTGTRLVPHPEPGVWEVVIEPTWDALNLGNLDSAQYHTAGEITLTVSVERLDAQVSAYGAVTWTNQGAAIDSATTVAALGARQTVRDTIDTAAPGPIHAIQVDSGTATLRIEVAPADTTADLELYLFDCTRGPCFLWNLDKSLAPGKGFLVRAPAPGTWKLAIDPARIVGGKTTCTYTQIQTNPKYGTATTSTSPAPRRPGETWPDSVTIEPTRTAPEGADLVAVADLLDQGAEAAEGAQPLAVFLGEPYRPVVLGTVVVPLR